MLHVLAQDAARQAAQVKSNTIGALHAAATAYGVKNAHLGLNDFLSSMDAIIAASGEPTETPAVTPDEIAFFERVERQALANQKNA